MALRSPHSLAPLAHPGHEPVRVVVAVALANRLLVRGALERAALSPVGEVATTREAVTAMARLHATACVLDAALPGDRDGAIRAIRAAQPHAVVVLLAAHATDDEVAAALAAGASGFVCGPAAAARAAEAISLAAEGYVVMPRATLDGLTRAEPAAVPALPEALTPREHEVLEAVSAGASTAEIAAGLGLSAVTVRRHVSGAMRKLGGTSREDLPSSPVRALRANARLTERERQVLRLAAAGWDNRAIADELFITASTVKNHMTRIMGKLGARNRTDAAVLAARHGDL